MLSSLSNTIPPFNPYIHKLFTLYTKNKTGEIWFNFDGENKEFVSCFSSYFVSSSIPNLLKYSIITNIFKNVSEIRCIGIDCDDGCNVINNLYIKSLIDEITNITKQNTKINYIKISQSYGFILFTI